MSPGDGEQLNALVRRGLRWKFISQGSLQGFRIVVGVLLARLLSPHDYGLAGMVLILSGVVLAFSDLGLGAALVQRRTVTERDRSTAFWTGILAGILLTAVGVGLAGPAADFYGEPRVRGLFAVFSLTFLITSLGTTQRAMLTREMNFKSLELRAMAGTFAGGVVGVTLAELGYGPWAIVFQQLAITGSSTVMLWLASSWRPRFMFSWTSLRRLGGFSGNVLAQRLLYYAHENAGSLLIGRFLGAAALGAFTVAYNVILIPFSRICIPIAEVLFPAFSRLQEERERLAESWLRAIRLIGAVSIAPLLGLAVVAPDFVHVVLGRRWEPAVPVIQILCWVGLQQALQSLNASAMLAIGRARTLFRYTIVFFVAHLAAFALGLNWGIVGVAVCYAVSTTLVEPLYFWLTARAVGVSPWVVLRALSGVVQASVAMLGVVLVARGALVYVGTTPLERLGVLIPLGAAIFAFACAWRAPEVLEEVRELRRRRDQRRTITPAPSHAQVG
jgi:O-antigen/teichoic acid export membrane protein